MMKLEDLEYALPAVGGSTAIFRDQRALPHHRLGHQISLGSLYLFAVWYAVSLPIAFVPPDLAIT